MSRTPTQPTGQPPQVLVRALRKVLRPMVHLMLSHQVTWPFLGDLVKSLYVEVAERDFRVDGKTPSDSRIHLLTGIHRKDVKRLREELATHGSPEVPGNISLGARLIAYWTGSSDYLDASGAPRPLALRGSPDEPGFEELVEQVCRKDIRPRVILDEWLRLDLAHIDAQKRVVLNTGAFTPDRGFDEKAFFFGKNLHDHVSAGAHNLMGQKPTHFDRSVYYDRLSAESVAELSELARDLGMQALRSMNSRALALQERDQQRNASDKNIVPVDYRMNFGIFHYNTQYEASTSSSEHQQGGPDA